MTERYYDLTEEEQQALDSYESSEMRSVTDLSKRKQELKEAVKNTLNKTRNINIRLSERDLFKLKAKAIEEGIPYQTLASSILHKEATK